MKSFTRCNLLDRGFYIFEMQFLRRLELDHILSIDSFRLRESYQMLISSIKTEIERPIGLYDLEGLNKIDSRSQLDRR